MALTLHKICQNRGFLSNIKTVRVAKIFFNVALFQANKITRFLYQQYIQIESVGHFNFSIVSKSTIYKILDNNCRSIGSFHLTHLIVNFTEPYIVNII